MRFLHLLLQAVNTIVHCIFTQPGKSHLVQLCKHTSVSLLVVGVQAVLEVEEAEEYPSSSLALASFSWVTVCSISCRDQNQYYIIFVSLFAMMTEHFSQYCIGYFPVLYYKLKLHLTPLTSYCSTDYLPQ